MNEYDKPEDLPEIHISVNKGDRDIHSTIPGDLGVYDIMDVFVGMLVSAGYKQETIDGWIKTNAADQPYR